jgi:hypothetical protein
MQRLATKTGFTKVGSEHKKQQGSETRVRKVSQTFLLRKTIFRFLQSKSISQSPNNTKYGNWRELRGILKDVQGARWYLLSPPSVKGFKEEAAVGTWGGLWEEHYYGAGPGTILFLPPALTRTPTGQLQPGATGKNGGGIMWTVGTEGCTAERASTERIKWGFAKSWQQPWKMPSPTPVSRGQSRTKGKRQESLVICSQNKSSSPPRPWSRILYLCRAV